MLFELGKFALSFYLGRESTASSFGAAGSVVLLLLWVYYASCILLFGAEFTQVYARETGHDIQPSANAVAVTAENRAQQGLSPEKSETWETTAPVQAQIIAITAPPAGRNPAGALLAVVAGSFAVGLLARRRAESHEPPMTRIREGLVDLGGQATEHLVELLHHTRDEIKRRGG